MIIKGTKKIALEWLSNGHLLIGQENNVIEISPAQVAELMRSAEQQNDPAINDYVGERLAEALTERSKRGA